MNASEAPLGALHVASPDWRDQIIYFLMIDRFDDGDADNNDQGAGEYDPSDRRKFSGGDLAGIHRRLDYIQGLGATALWITPPVANQWWDSSHQYGGYHGYWAEHFMRVDRHFGDLDAYRQLSRALHGRGMFLIQDVVLNHTGNFFKIDEGFDPERPSHGFKLVQQGAQRAPSQSPFDLNDAREDSHREAGIYHWTPDIRDFTDRKQELNWQLAGLDDLNTDNPRVRAALRESYAYWIRETGVDAFRVDTAFYVPPELFDDFLAASDAHHPGIAKVAASTGRNDFHVFGEGFGIDRAFEDVQARRIDAYMRSEGGTALPGMINFPLYGTTLDVFARGRPTAELAHRIRSMMSLHADPHRMPTFVDNHDVDRFLAGGSEAALRQSLLLIMTLPGIPTIYYGTEQGFREPRKAMFAGGHDSGGRDHFDTGSGLYRYLAGVSALRRTHKLFSRGTPEVLADTAAGPGVLAYRMHHGSDAALVVFNTSASPMLLDGLRPGGSTPQRLLPLFGIDAPPQALNTDAEGRIHLQVPPHAGMVWKLVPDESIAKPTGTAQLTIGAPPQTRVQADLELTGMAQAVERFELVVDGNLETAQNVSVAEDGRWTARIDTAGMLDPGLKHRAVAWSAPSATVSNAIEFTVNRLWRPLIERRDPDGDDRGRSGRYRYPKDPDWSVRRPLDLHAVRVLGSGGALRIELTLNEIVAGWNPANGFDHVAFTVFIGIPGRDGGARVMPLQNGDLPGSMRWHYRIRAHGWSNALFSAEGASASHEGTAITPGANIEVDREHKRIAFTLPPAALGGLDSLSGLQIHVNTWDWDGRYRALEREPGAHAFGGREREDDALLMDETDVIVLP